MTRRSPRLRFARGAMVFPGGKLDPEDGSEQVLARIEVAAGTDVNDAPLRVAAVREAFEEVSVLLAEQNRAGRGVTPEHAARIVRLWRERVHSEPGTFAEMLEQENLWLPIGSLVPFARWITPERSPRRFDARFYLAALPPGQEAVHDGVEAHEGVWLRPEAAMEAAAEGRLPLLFPTRATLSKLRRFSDVAEALAGAAAFPVEPLMTEYVERNGRTVMRIPDGLGYTLTEIPVGD